MANAATEIDDLKETQITCQKHTEKKLDLWAQPMEGLGDLSDLEDWNRPTERLWDSPTENLLDEPADRPPNGRRGADQASSALSTESVSAKVSASERPQPRPPRPEQPVSSRPPLQRAGAVDDSRHGPFREDAVREQFPELWDDSPSEGVWDTPTAEGLWDGPMERVTDEEGDRRRRPPEYNSERKEELPPTYDECVRLGMAK